MSAGDIRKKEVFQAVSMDGENRIEFATIPIIVLPGLMASRLRFPRTILWDYTWDPDDNAAMVGFWVAQTSRSFSADIHQTRPASVMTEGKFSKERLARGWGGPSKKYYGKMLEFLEGLDFGATYTPVYAVGYDWRQCNAESAAYVEKEVRRILSEQSTDRFILITHSMGGLVGRALLKKAPDLSKQALGVVHIGQPANGASVMYRRMFTGTPLEREELEMRALLGSKPHQFQRIVSGLRAPIQLLPTDRLRGPDGGNWLCYHAVDRPNKTQVWAGKASELYPSKSSPPGVIAEYNSQPHWIEEGYRIDLRQSLNRAAVFHSVLGNWCHENTWTISTFDLETDHTIEFTLPPKNPKVETISLNQPGVPPQQIVYGELENGKRVYWHEKTLGWDRKYEVQGRSPNDLGDGTVPLQSSTDLLDYPTHSSKELSEDNTENLRQILVSGVEHSAMCNDAQVTSALKSILTHIIGACP